MDPYVSSLTALCTLQAYRAHLYYVFDLIFVCTAHSTCLGCMFMFLTAYEHVSGMFEYICDHFKRHSP